MINNFLLHSCFREEAYNDYVYVYDLDIFVYSLYKYQMTNEVHIVSEYSRILSVIKSKRINKDVFS